MELILAFFPFLLLVLLLPLVLPHGGVVFVLRPCIGCSWATLHRVFL